MPSVIERKLIPAAYTNTGSGVNMPVPSYGTSDTKTYTLTGAIDGTEDYSIADIHQLSIRVYSAFSGPLVSAGLFSVRKLSEGQYAGANWGMYSFQGIEGYANDISWSGKDLTVTVHVWDAAGLTDSGIPVGTQFGYFLQFADLYLNLVKTSGGGTEPTVTPTRPALTERALSGIHMRWHRREVPEDVALHEVGRLGAVTWPWAGWSARRVLMDELHRSVRIEDNPPATRREDIWTLFTYPGTGVAGGDLYFAWDTAGSGWDEAAWRPE